jgi:hypothetical protein
MAEFTAAAHITVYTALDTRVLPVPAWLGTWEKTGMSCASSNDVTFDLYARSFAPGETVTLGVNFDGNACVNYCVFITENTSVTDTEGDVNADGSVTAADLGAMKNLLLGVSTANAEQRANADLDKNGTVNILDLILLISKFL